jgi:hypothetical protein
VSDNVLHAFSLPAPAEARSSRRPYQSGWRPAFSELWKEIAAGQGIEGQVDPTRVAINASRAFEVLQRDLLSLWHAPGSSRCSPLRCAAEALELNTQVWRAFGPAAGGRHLHLLRRLEETLAATERQIRAAELPLLVIRPAVSVAVRSAGGAIDGLLRAEGDRAEALAALEDAALDLAALAVRIALNLDEFGGARRTRRVRSPTLTRHLERLAREVSATSLGACTTSGWDEAEDHVGVWLSAALRVDPMPSVVRLAWARDADRCLRTDALLSLRACCLRLAVALWMVVRELDLLLDVATFSDTAHLERAVSSRAHRALTAADLCRCPSNFDHEEAWKRHREALGDLVSDACRSLQSRAPDTVARAQQPALRRLARILAAMWAIDAQLRSPGESSPAPRMPRRPMGEDN